MRPSVVLLASALLFGSAFTAHASDITYDVVGGTLTPSGSFYGSFNINSATEDIDGGTFFLTAPSGGTAFTFTGSAAGSVPGSKLFTDAGGDSFRLNLNGAIGSLAVNTLALFGASGDTELTLASGARYDATGGSIVAAATPEPSSLLLLGSGALGLAGIVRRRILAS